MGRIKNKYYFRVYGWMVNEFNLKGNELLIYAIICGLTKRYGNGHVITLSYFAEFANCARSTAQKAVDALCDKQIIRKETRTKEDGQYETRYFNLYERYVNLYDPPPSSEESQEEPIPKSGTPYTENEHTPIPKSGTPYTENEHTPIPKSGTKYNNKYNNNNTSNIAVVVNSSNDLSEIYKSWSNNIHPIAPMEAEKVKALYDEVGYGNLARAIEKAVAANARNFYYIQKVARGLAEGVDFDNKPDKHVMTDEEILASINY